MNYLQYVLVMRYQDAMLGWSFKPCYKWITFNINTKDKADHEMYAVLNLVINGLPSISLPKV